MRLKLVNKKEEAKGTVSFFFEPDQEVKWLPGQFYYYTLPTLKYNDSRGPTRHFTISSSPTEGKLLQLTTRIREQSGYKKSLNELKIGTEIEGDGPSGTFILDDSEQGKNHVFLAGGIGITPFRSFIKYAADKKLNTPMNLIYSNSLPEEIAFREELENWSKEFNFFTLNLTVSKPEESKEKWIGQTGRIDAELIKKLVPDHKSASTHFWIVGPPAFNDAMEKELSKLQAPEARVHSEKFTGY